MHYCYGKRSNHFLLLNYGFCLENNVFDSFEIWLNIDVENIKVDIFNLEEEHQLEWNQRLVIPYM